MQIAYNRTKATRTIEYIVIHDTGNRAAGADARAHFAYFNGGDRQSSADFFVDDKEILQVNDYNTYYTWHCGDGAGRNGITNKNSIGLELCINEDGAYEQAFANLVTLTRRLMAELSIPKQRVVRHYDVSGKNCPQTMRDGGWEQFQKELEEKQVARTVYHINNTYKQEIYPPNLGFRVYDRNKRTIPEENYFNAGFFANTAEGTIPVGNLASDGVIYAQSKENPDWINVSGKALTTLYVKNDGSFGIEKMDSLEGKDIKTAISGIPITRNRKQVTLSEIKEEGYDGSELYDTWHNFLGIAGTDIYLVAAKCDFGEMHWLMVALGLTDAIKLDGGGSFILYNGELLQSTAGNRRIHNVGIWQG